MSGNGVLGAVAAPLPDTILVVALPSVGLGRLTARLRTIISIIISNSIIRHHVLSCDIQSARSEFGVLLLVHPHMCTFEEQQSIVDEFWPTPRCDLDGSFSLKAGRCTCRRRHRRRRRRHRYHSCGARGLQRWR